MAAPNSNGFMVPVKTNTRKSPYEGGHELERSSMRLYILRRKKRADIQRARGTTEIKNVHSQRGAELMNPFGGAIKRRCVALLNSLLKEPSGSTFSKPVDPKEWNGELDDYFEIIKRPMDLGTVMSELKANRYSSLLQFAEDVRLTFTNAMTYNPQHNWAHRQAEEMKGIFELKWQKIYDLYQHGIVGKSNSNATVSKQKHEETSQLLSRHSRMIFEPFSHEIR